MSKITLPYFAQKYRDEQGPFIPENDFLPEGHQNSIRKFENGDFYEGQTNAANLFDGYGIFVCGATDEVYEGDWKEHKRDGKGRAIYKNQAVYEGSFIQDKKHGVGKYTWPNGDIYEGEFDQNQLHGKGRKTYSSLNEYYEGQFNQGIKETIEGDGTYEFNGQIMEYTGHDPHGLGTYQYADGKFYKGQWKENKMEGYGEMNWSADEIYKGYWKDNKRHGVGIQTWLTGEKQEPVKLETAKKLYQEAKEKVKRSMTTDEKQLLKQSIITNWHNDKVEGFGKMTYTDNTIYVGNFKANCKDGLGKINYPDDSVHLGEYFKGLADGPGYFKWPHYGLKTEAKPELEKAAQQDPSESQRNLIHDEEQAPIELPREQEEFESKTDTTCMKFTKIFCCCFSFLQKKNDKDKQELAVCEYIGMFEKGKKHGEASFKDQKGNQATGYWEKNKFKSWAPQGWEHCCNKKNQ